jgi:hypothetical protein
MNGLIKLSALALAGSGVYALTQPEKAAKTSNLTATTSEDRQDLRALHGAAPLVMAGLLVLRPRSAGTIALILGGAAAGRAASLAMDGDEPSTPAKVAIGIEAGIAAAILLGRTQIAAADTASAIAGSVSDASSAIQSAGQSLVSR